MRRGWLPELAQRARSRLVADDVIPSPNVWHWPELYEIENRAQDVHGAIWRVLAEVAEWGGRDVLDVGCGDGFHLAHFAETARSVVGVEPHPPLLQRAQRRVTGMSNVTVLAGAAQKLQLADASVDMVHARTAYFFGPGCEPGILEADRVLRPGGTLVIVDLDAGVPPYGDWMRADLPSYRPAEVEKFFALKGFACRKVDTEWRFGDRDSLAAVLGIEFSERVAQRALRQLTGLSFRWGTGCTPGASRAG